MIKFLFYCNPYTIIVLAFFLTKIINDNDEYYYWDEDKKQ
jgi:hypothetical protein